MAGKLSWQLEITGVEQVGQKLAQLDKLATSIGSNKGIRLADFSNTSASTRALNPDLFKEMGKKAGIAFENARFEAMNDLARRNITGSSSSMIDLQARIAQADYDQNNPKTRGGIGRFKGISSLIGGEGGAQVGKLLGLATEFGIALFLAKRAIQLFSDAIGPLVQAIQRGSKLYLDSARIGITTSRLAKVQNAASLIGMDESEVQSLLLRGQFGNRRSGGSATRPSSSSRAGGAYSILGELFGAYGPSQLGDLQKAINLNKELDRAVRDTALATHVGAQAAHALYEEQYGWNLLVIDFKALMEQLAQSLYPVIKYFEEFLDLIIRSQVLLAKLWQLITPASLLTPGDDSEKFKKTGIGSARFPVSQFEKIGFTYGGFGGGKNPADMTAKNTTTMVGLLRNLPQQIATAIAPHNLGQNGKEKATLEQFMRDHPLNNLP